MERWAGGEEFSVQDQAIAVVYGDIVTLQYDNVAEFYEKEEEDTDAE